MKLRILFHDNCFDGLCSAALFRAFHRRHVEPGSEVLFGGLAHGPTGGLGPERLDGDENAVVDFRYLADDRLTWWFDHHRSAFPDDDQRRHFEADRSGRKYYDPTAPSCAGFLARSLARERGFDIAPYGELIRWADIIDAARFEDPRTAVELEAPALKLMLWVEHSRDFEERVELIEHLTVDPFERIVELPFVRKRLDGLLDEHHRMIEAFRARARFEDGVVFCDLTDLEVSAVNKFIPYHLYPGARYAVVVTRSPTRSKVSVGYSPWEPPDDRRHDIAALCERYGGGGHPMVGAVTLAREAVDDARRVGREMVERLKA